MNRQSYLLSRKLDADAGEMVLRKVEAMGVQIVTNAKVAGITTSTAFAGDHERFAGFQMDDGSHFASDMVICAVGIRGRDDLAKNSGITCEAKGGVKVDDDLRTSAADVYAIGECANWRGNTYGLIAPGIEMADSTSYEFNLSSRRLNTYSTVLSFNLTQTNTSMGTHSPRKMNDPDLSTKLKLMGVDVASFGDFFADKDPSRMQSSIEFHKRKQAEKEAENNSARKEEQAKLQIILEDGGVEAVRKDPTPPKIKHRGVNLRDEPIKCLTYKDPFGSVYKK